MSADVDRTTAHTGEVTGLLAQVGVEVLRRSIASCRFFTTSCGASPTASYAANGRTTPSTRQRWCLTRPYVKLVDWTV